MTKIHLTDGQIITIDADFEEVMEVFKTNWLLRPKFVIIEVPGKKILLNYDCVVCMEGD